MNQTVNLLVRRLLPALLSSDARKNTLVPILLALGAWLTVAPSASAQTLMMQFGFNDAGQTTTDSVNGVVLNLVDSSGAAADLHGASGSGVAGAGQALDLTSANSGGSGPLAWVSSSSAIDFESLSNFTLTMWMKPQQTISGYPRFFELGAPSISDVNSSGGFGFSPDTGGNGQLFINGGSKIVLPGFNALIPGGQWTFIALAYDGNANVTLYTGSESSPVGTPQNLVRTVTTPMNVGSAFRLMIGNNAGRSRAFDGWIDDVRFYTGDANSNFVEAVRASAIPDPFVGATVITPNPVPLNSSATVIASAGGTQPISYQWIFTDTNGTTAAIAGATNSSYTLASAQFSDAGTYQLVVSNSISGPVTNLGAMMIVKKPVLITDAGTTAPTPSGDDISQLTEDTAASPTGLNYYTDNGEPPGQTFTTGSNPDGYALASLYVKFGSGGSHGVGNPWTLRLYSLSAADATTATLIGEYQNDNVAPAMNDNWCKWFGEITNILSPNSVYAYTIRARSADNNSGSGYLKVASSGGDLYSGGQAVDIDEDGNPVDQDAVGYDGTFLLHLVPAGQPGIANISVSPGSTVVAGETVTLVASTVGTNLTYSWQQDSASVGANDNVLSVNTASLSAGTHAYQLTVANGAGSATSEMIYVEVVPAIINFISLAPENTTTNPVYAGTPVTLSASVDGTNLTYIWQQDGVDIPGSNTNIFSLDTSAMSPGTHTYTLRVTNNSGEVDSATSLTLNLVAASGPVLTSGTALNPGVVILGTNATMTATFAGSQPMTYQWFFDNGSGAVAISDATNTSYTITGAQTTNQGFYYLTAYNNPPGLGAQQSNSASAYLYVVVAPETNTSLAKISDGGTFPYIDTYDVSQTTDAQVTPPDINYYVDNTANPPGQVFTTSGTLPPGYTAFPLTYVYFKHDAAGGGSGNATAQTYILRVYKMLDGTNAQLLTSYVTANTLAFTAGDWLRVDGLTNMLAPDSTYAISLARNTSGYWRLACTVYASPGPNGQAVLIPASGGAVQFSSPDSQFGYYYDAAYVAGLTPPTAPVVLADTTVTPSTVYNGQGPVTMAATFTGQKPISYQWQHDGTNVIGATNNTYTIPTASYADGGSYSLLASNSLSSGTSVASAPQTLTVSTPPTTSFVANFAYWNTHPGAASPGYSGPGVIGSGTIWNRPVPGTATNIFNGTAVTLCQNPPPAVADDGSDLGAMTFNAYATKTDDYYWYSSVPDGEITLLDTFMDNQSTNVIPFGISNVFNGCYNLVLFGENGRSTSARTTFTVNGVSQTLTNTSASLNRFVKGDNYAVFYNIAVTNGSITGTWGNPNGSASAVFNGAQLQMAYSAENPQMFIVFQPTNTAVPVDSPASLSVLAEGPGTNWLPGPVFYQWYDANNNLIVGATNNIYSPDTSAAFTNTYYCVITNLTGLSIASDAATISVFQPDTLLWLGSVGDIWDTATANWNDISSLTSPAVYTDGDVVRFDDSASNFNVNNAVAVTPDHVVVTNNIKNYVFYGSGNIGGIGGLTKSGSGTLTISNNLPYTGGTIVNGGTLVLAKGGAAGTLNGTLTANPGTIISLVAGDALGYSGNHVTILNLNGATLDNATSGNESYATTWNLTGGTMTSSGGGAYNIDGANGWSINSLATNVASIISGNIAMRSSGLVISTEQGTVPSGIDLAITGVIRDSGGRTLDKNGSGALSLQGTNTFNGDIHINAGKLSLDGSGRLNSGSYTAHLFINGASFSYNSSAAQDLGDVSGTGALIQNGPGQLTINGVIDYTGDTVVNGGTLEIVQGMFNTNSTVTVASGGGLQLDFAGQNRVGSLVLAGVTQPSGIYNSANSGGLISGSGSLVVGMAGPSEPAPITSTYDPGTGVLSLSWPAGEGWRLQVQTNDLAKGLGTNWVYVTDGSESSANITVDKSSPTAFYRLIYP